MRYLVRLVTPPGGVVLDPFMGSGSTGCAAVLEGFDFVGIERDEAYFDIARARLAYWEQFGPLPVERKADTAKLAQRKPANAAQLDLFGAVKR